MTAAEAAWSGAFGAAYHDRCRPRADLRQRFWSFVAETTEARSALEVGCGPGVNLICLRRAGVRRVVGVDLHEPTLGFLSAGIAVRARATELPFGTGAFDLVVTCGLLIHVAEVWLFAALGELSRVARRWIVSAEYEGDTVIPYRDCPEPIYRRPYRVLWELGGHDVQASWELGPDAGFDRVTAHLVRVAA